LPDHGQILVEPQKHGAVATIVEGTDFGLGISLSQSPPEARAEHIRIGFGDQYLSGPVLEILRHEVKPPVVIMLDAEIRQEIVLGKSRCEQLIEIRGPECRGFTGWVNYLD
jgi:hypothetical protein